MAHICTRLLRSIPNQCSRHDFDEGLSHIYDPNHQILVSNAAEAEQGDGSAEETSHFRPEGQAPFSRLNMPAAKLPAPGDVLGGGIGLSVLGGAAAGLTRLFRPAAWVAGA